MPMTQTVLDRLGEIKRANKEAFAAYAKKTRGVELNPDAIFDVQVKRLHEYKRQLLNVLHIIALYQKLQDDPERHHPAPHLPVRRQGGAGLRGGQADHPPHQLPGGPDRPRPHLQG